MSTIYGNMVGGASLAQTYILQDSEGNEFTATLVDSETVFDATPNDIRLGKVAATETGVTVGTKEIPSYHTTEGVMVITAGSEFIIPTLCCEYTKLQVLICKFNSSTSDSVSTEKVSINGKVYPSNSTEELATVIVDVENSQINLGISNEETTPCVMRYFTYKEEK